MPERIIISRTDSNGDVILTLPMAGAIKRDLPAAEVLFLGRDYTKDVIALSGNVDRFLSWDDVSGLHDRQKAKWMRNLQADVIIQVLPRQEIARTAAKAAIPLRIGSTGRLYHYRYCNKLVPLSRKRSPLHEAQLNFPLLRPLIHDIAIPAMEEMPLLYGISKPIPLPPEWQNLVDKDRFNLVLHPRSKGSAREWPLDHYSELIRMLPENRFRIFVTGTREEAQTMDAFLQANKDRIIDMTGRLSLQQFIRFLGMVDGLVAASTGPLHIAAALGKKAVGIYPPIKPMHPGRWAPLGPRARYLVADRACNNCRKTVSCHCMTEITPEQVMNVLTNDK